MATIAASLRTQATIDNTGWRELIDTQSVWFILNHYARLIHAATAGGAGYAFPYDDVHIAGYNAEGRVVDPRPSMLTNHLG